MTAKISESSRDRNTTRRIVMFSGGAVVDGLRGAAHAGGDRPVAFHVHAVGGAGGSRRPSYADGIENSDVIRAASGRSPAIFSRPRMNGARPDAGQ